MSVRDRVGKLTAGSTEVLLRLAKGRDLPIAKSWSLPQLPPSYDPAEFTINEPTNEAVRRWKAYQFDGGEGAPIWDASSDEYNKSIGVRPAADGRGGLELCAQTTNPADATLTTAKQLGSAATFGLAAIDSTKWFYWDEVGEEFDPASGYNHGMTSPATPVVGAGALFCGEFSGGDLRKFFVSSSSVHVDGASVAWSTSAIPWPVTWGGNLYCVSENDLYLVDMATANTITLKSDVGGAPRSLAQVVNRVVSGDVGPIWFGQDAAEEGRTLIYQYNVGADTTEVISRNDLPNYVVPTDLFYSNGFLFVTYKRGYPYWSSAGDAYLYYQRGSQRGSIGPLPDPDGINTTLYMPTIAGIAGDQLIIVWGDYVWGYDFTSGGLSMVAALRQTPTFGACARIFGSDVFVVASNGSGGTTVERIETKKKYSTAAITHYLDTGRFDLGWPGMDKALIDIVVTTDPLPANTSVQVAYSVDGDSFTTHATTSATDGDTVHTFTVSTPSSAVVGESFEVRVILDTTSEDASPRVWEIMVRASIDELEFTYDLEIDLGDSDQDVLEHQILADLDTLAAVPGFMTFTNPWMVAEHASPTEEVVKVVGIGKPEISDDGVRYASLRLKGRDVA